MLLKLQCERFSTKQNTAKGLSEAAGWSCLLQSGHKEVICSSQGTAQDPRDREMCAKDKDTKMCSPFQR